MIHSAIHDNWDRVQIMHNVAYDYYCLTKNSEHRESCRDRTEFAFDASVFEIMNKESCVIGMLMAWSVITIESLVNHVIAEIIPNKLLAIKAIEFPKEIVSGDKFNKNCKSELAKKIIIINDGNDNIIDIISTADKLSNNRNSIVHDKPFELIDHENGDVEIVNYSLRNCEGNVSNKYEDLKVFFEDCDKVKDYILSVSNLKNLLYSHFSSVNFSFSTLINEQK
jgi:hypothetical protein